MTGANWAWAPASVLGAAAAAFAWGYLTGRRKGRDEGAARRSLELRAEALGTGRCTICDRTLRTGDDPQWP